MSIADRMLRLLEDSGEDPGDLVREVMRWMKGSAESAKKFAGRVDSAVKGLNANAAGEIESLGDVLRHFEMMFADSAKAAKDTLLATMRFESTDLDEGKKPPIVSLSRWLMGAKPAVGSYVKKIGALKGSVNLSKPAQEALLHVNTALEQMNQAIETLAQHVPTLVKALTK